MDYEVLNVERDRDGNIESFLIVWDGGSPEIKNGTPKNILLFEHGMYDFLSGDTVIQVGENPDVIVGSDDTGYVLSVGGDTISVPPANEAGFLKGVQRAIEGNDTEKIESMYSSIIAGRVRRDVINALPDLFQANRERITTQANGWLIDDYILVDWNANVYTKDDDLDEGDYIRSGGSVTKTDESYELVKLRANSIDTDTVTIGGDVVRLSENECEFLGKVKFLLNRREYHPDKPFWDVVDRHTSYDEDDDDPDSYKIPGF